MKNYKLNSIAGYAIALMILLAAASSHASLENMKTFDGHPVIIESGKVTHLIFQEIWSSYEGLGEEARIAELPKTFIDSSQQIWVQPSINVTEAQLTEYQGYYPQVKPLVLDRGYQLMRSFGEWELPLHVIIKDGKQVFSGSGDELTQWLQLDKGDLGVKVVDNAKAKPVSFSIKQAAKPRFHKPEEGDQAPVFTVKTMAGDAVSLLGLSNNKPLSLVFLDSLCPMPHFPGCEAQIAQLSNLVESDGSRQWLGIVSSFYVNEEVVRQFRKKFQLKLPLVFDMDNQIYQSYGVHASPYQVVIGRDGNIQSRGSDIH